MHLTIVGGCFPVQHNVAPERLYYRTTLRTLAEAGVAATAGVVRYERLSTCLAKVERALGEAPGADGAVVFHLRAEPVMRLTKLYYRHLDGEGRLRHALNLPGLGRLSPERYDLLTVQPRTPVPRRPLADRDGLHRSLLTGNYVAGTLLGNRAAALQRYVRLVDGVAALCARRRVRLVVVGPVSRPALGFEDRLSVQIDAVLAPRVAALGVPYVPALGRRDEAGRDLFFPNGIHVSPAGHDRIGRRLVAPLLQGMHGEEAGRQVEMRA